MNGRFVALSPKGRAGKSRATPALRNSPALEGRFYARNCSWRMMDCLMHSCAPICSYVSSSNRLVTVVEYIFPCDGRKCKRVSKRRGPMECRDLEFLGAFPAPRQNLCFRQCLPCPVIARHVLSPIRPASFSCSAPRRLSASCYDSTWDTIVSRYFIFWVRSSPN